ncbi:STAS domain-containing protein [Desulfoplanes sp.]
MQLTREKAGNYLLIKAEGRLDASWADYFLEELRESVRQGEHHMVIDAAGLVFLSSAGIRSLLILHKELRAVAGGFSLVNAYGIVRETLTCSGFAQWLAADMPEDPGTGERGPDDADQGVPGCEVHLLDAQASLELTTVSAWTPWNPVDRNMCRLMRCASDGFALGIGCVGRDYDLAREHMGEFLAVAGHVVHQPPSDRSRPDYMLAEKDFVPTLFCAQALLARGGMSHLLRFESSQEEPVWELSRLMDRVLALTGNKASGFAIMGEIEGVVGGSLTRSPGAIMPGQDIVFPEIRDWLSFCGERIFAHEQALITGVVAPGARVPTSASLPALPSRSDLLLHAHGAVFPYQPLPNGIIELGRSVEKWLDGPPPRAVMHLVDDNRPAVGLGETGLIRGALWCSPLANPEVLA